jgi:methylated-DNA-[protein]-cysteine S-methyltransferase
VFDVTVDFPKMKVGVRIREGRIVEIRYLPLSAPGVEPKDALAEKAKIQLERYRDDPDAAFDLPIKMEGTELQKRVWQAMREIPRGETRTYGEIAKELGGDDWELNRVVGQACGDNKLPIVIPCHRVVAANGIGGFAHSTDGYLIEAKRWLLNHEIRREEFELKG